MKNGFKFYLIAAIAVLVGDILGHALSCMILGETRPYVPYGEHYLIDILIIVCLAERLIDNNKEQ